MEEKNKFALRMTDKTQALVREWYDKSGCRSQNEFIEKTIQFYAGYLSAEEGEAYLSVTVTRAIHSPLKNAVDRIARLLFKLCVEVSIMAKVFALGLQIDPKDLERLRGECVREVKASNGSISFKEAVISEQQKFKATPSAQRFYVDSQRVELEAYAIQGHNYIKLRDIGRVVDFGVSYDPQTNSVIVTSGSPYQDEAPTVTPPATPPRSTPPRSPATSPGRSTTPS